MIGTIKNKAFEKIKMISKDRMFRVCVVSAIVCALIAHGMGLFNKYSFHDDSDAFTSVGATYSSGRWMLGWLGSLMELIFV